MTHATEITIGIDVGTTSMKAHAFALDGSIVGRASLATQWNVLANGETEINVDALADAAISVMAQCVPETYPLGSVIGIGITGMAETGVLVDSQGQPLMPAIAWFDERGKQELENLPLEFASDFVAHTGLGFKAECSFSKLLWRQECGQEIPPGAQWLNALEYIAFRLTNRKVTEPSLASRTGLWDQEMAAPWLPSLACIGAHASLLPEIYLAGTSIGTVVDSAPSVLRGAQVTVAGHDHLVGAVGSGAVDPNDLYNSCGTADVVLRSVERTLANSERTALVSRGVSAGHHVIPGATAILGATRSGLVLGRVLTMLGIHDRDDRIKFVNAWDPTQSFDVRVSEPPAWANEVTISLRGEAAPADVWSGAMAYVLGATSELVHVVDDLAGPYHAAIAAGGWANLDGVFRGKSQVMPGLRRFTGEEPGARGAAALAAWAAHQPNVPLTAGLAVSFAPPTPKELVS